MRLDRWLWCMRFAKSRSIAKAMAEQGHIRINSKRIMSAHSPVHVGSVLTIWREGRGTEGVTVCRVLAMPESRISAKLIGQHIQMLDDTPPVKLAGFP
jgi:ribosome-associated heat shock protein Hsp15